jgi:thymidylate kinase
MIIHISGPSGSGKTTLGNKLKQKFGAKITLCDIDDLRTAFIKWFYMGKSFKKIDPIAYQKYIDSYVVKHAYKPLVFVGLNVMPWWHKSLYYDLHANYKFYIKIDTKTILLQRFIRELTNVQKDKKAIDDLIKDNKKFLKLFHQFVDRELSMKTLVEHISTIEPNYKKQKYTFASRDLIFNTVCKLLTDELKK